MRDNHLVSINNDIVFIFLAHSPDNSFIGFVSGSKQSVLQISSEEYSKKNKGLVYGKLDYYWNVSYYSYKDSEKL